jgi:mRNA interferase MazF
MKTGSIVLIPFPFSDLKRRKLRPALVITTTKDEFEDIILCALSSVVPEKRNDFQIPVNPTKKNGLRVESIIRVDRIVTIQRGDIVLELGILEKEILDKFKKSFRRLAEG